MLLTFECVKQNFPGAHDMAVGTTRVVVEFDKQGMRREYEIKRQTEEYCKVYER